MIPHAAAKSQYQVCSRPIGKPRLLIISDTMAGLTKLRASLDADNLEIVGAISPQDLAGVTREAHDLAVIDVGPAQITAVLKVLRGSAEHQNIPLLVEASRIVADSSLAGVLPTYRAMPCGPYDLITLVRNQISPASSGRVKPRLL